MIVGTNILREISKLRVVERIPEEWDVALNFITGSISVVKTTRKMTVHLYETKTVTGIMRKTQTCQLQEAVTENIDRKKQCITYRLSLCCISQRIKINCTYSCTHMQYAS